LFNFDVIYPIMIKLSFDTSKLLNKKQEGIGMQNRETISPARPPFWLKMSINTGNLVQLVGLVLGIVLLVSDARSQAPGAIRVIWMIAGWFVIYICSHASAHWAVGRLVGIRFQAYGLRGTDHPENYPAGFRQLMSAMPTFTAMTDKASMKKASPIAKALMFSAGETSTTLFSILTGLYAWQSGIPGGLVLFIFMVVFTIISTVATATIPRGDYAKAWKALHNAQGNTSIKTVER
jgi:hypothetical protein